MTTKRYRRRLSTVVIVVVAALTPLRAQIPVEVFGGHERSTLDIMFFKYIKDGTGANTPFLFFNRNRASVDYRMTTTAYLPQFGFTEAVSYNSEHLSGFAPVFVTQVFGSGLYTKAGMQYAMPGPELTVFSWVVSEIRSQPTVDVFFLGRYTPRLTERLQLFTQLELVNAMPTVGDKSFSFTQRIRVGLKVKELQFGVAADLSQTGRSAFAGTRNAGLFIRFEF